MEKRKKRCFKIQALNLRGLVHNERTRDMALNSFYQLISKRKNELKENKDVRFSPQYVLSILDDSLLSGHGLNEFLAEDMSQYGVTVIWCKEAQAQLPETITTMVSYYSSQSGTLVNESGVYVNKGFTPNQLPQKITTTQAIKRLANLTHMEVEKNAIPQFVTFLGMYGVKKLEELDVLNRWEKANTAKTLAVPIGLRGKDDIVDLNLHEKAHGPHGLVAGTTGSGKSETLQTYILSLAVNFPPEDFGFLVIDFKGGGMVNEFANLPHLMGAITNLDGAASARALASIKAEQLKRQAEFGKYDVNHIDGYTKLYKKGKTMTAEQRQAENLPDKPIPHLFLISDEFAELKANEPEFMAELVSVARIGRSLGVHLILATQKPSGVVDDQIWSNTKFRLALKVANEADSNEILKTPDAARIVETGRGYLQVGNNEIYELFQSAWSGPVYDPDKKIEEKIDDRVWLMNDLGQYELLTFDSSENDDNGTKKDDLLTELRATVNHIKDLTIESNAVIPDKPWLPSLEEIIIAPTTNPEENWQKERHLAVNIGYMDFPNLQDQQPYLFDLNEVKHTAIFGSSGFGKSSVLQTIVMSLARQNSPESLHFYLADFGTNGLLPLKNLPHTSDLARMEDEEKLIKLLNIIKTEVANRKEMFTENSVANLEQYEAKTKQKLPVIVTVVDAYDAIKDNQSLSTQVDEMLVQLVRDGASIGIYLLITGLKPNSIRMNISSNIPTKIGLFFNDEGDIKEIVGRDSLPLQEMAGRAQIKLDQPRAFQFYMMHAGEEELDRLNALNAEIDEMNNNWTGSRPKPVPMLPKEITMDYFLENEEVKQWIKDGNVPLGFSNNTTEVRGYKPLEHPYFLVADGDMSQTEYIKMMVEETFKRHTAYNRVVFDMDGSYEDRDDLFDEIYTTDDVKTVMPQIIAHVKGEVFDPNTEVDKTEKTTETKSSAYDPVEPATPYVSSFSLFDDLFAEDEPEEMVEEIEESEETIDATPVSLTEKDDVLVEEFEEESNATFNLFDDLDDEDANGIDIMLEFSSDIDTKTQNIIEEFENIEEVTALENSELKIPMLVYVPTFSDVINQLDLNDADAKKFIKVAQEKGVYFLFHGQVQSLNGFRSGLGRYLKEMTRTGMVGQKISEQQFVTAKRSHSEPPLADGEHVYFDKKLIERIKTIATS